MPELQEASDISCDVDSLLLSIIIWKEPEQFLKSLALSICIFIQLFHLHIVRCFRYSYIIFHHGNWFSFNMENQGLVQISEF